MGFRSLLWASYSGPSPCRSQGITYDVLLLRDTEKVYLHSVTYSCTVPMVCTRAADVKGNTAGEGCTRSTKELRSDGHQMKSIFYSLFLTRADISEGVSGSGLTELGHRLN